MLLYLGGGDECECRFDNSRQRWSAVSTCESLGTIAPELQRAAQHAGCACISAAQMSSKGCD